MKGEKESGWKRSAPPPTPPSLPAAVCPCRPWAEATLRPVTVARYGSIAHTPAHNAATLSEGIDGGMGWVWGKEVLLCANLRFIISIFLSHFLWTYILKIINFNKSQLRCCLFPKWGNTGGMTGLLQCSQHYELSVCDDILFMILWYLTFLLWGAVWWMESDLITCRLWLHACCGSAPKKPCTDHLDPSGRRTREFR